MKERFFLIISALSIYCCLYAGLRLSHVITHYYGYDVCQVSPGPDPLAWHELRPARNVYLWPIHTKHLYPSKSKIKALAVLGIHYSFKPLSACEESFWYWQRPYWIEHHRYQHKVCK